jgi:hypothetical protein
MIQKRALGSSWCVCFHFWRIYGVGVEEPAGDCPLSLELGELIGVM